jgi:RND superfamily putative drug exporter
MQSTPSRFVRLARACNRHRWRTFGAWLLALVAVQVIAGAVGVREISSFRLPNTESQRAYDLLAANFPAAKGDTDQLVFQARSGTLRDAGNRDRIEAALERVQADDEVAEVTSPFDAGGQITEDGRIGVAMLNYKESTNDIQPAALEEVEKAAFTARSDELQVEHGGPGAQIVRFSTSQEPSEGIGLLLAAVVLLITFGSAVAAGLPLLATILAMGTTLGVITLISHVVDTPDFAAQLATLIGIGVGIDYALFVVTRYRAEIRNGLDRDLAIEKAIDTAGRTVMFAGITVIIALLGLLLLGLKFMQGVALGSATAVLASMFAALTIIPALIGGSGSFIDGGLRELDRRGGLRLPFMQRRFRMPGGGWRARRGAKREQRRADGAGWERWSRGVQRRPWLAAGVSLLLLVGLALPAVGMRLGSSDAGVDPEGTTTRKAYDLIAQGFGAGTNGSFLLVADLARAGDEAAADQLADAVRAERDFSFVAPPSLSPDGQIATINAYPRTGPQDERTEQALDRLRGGRRAGGRAAHGGDGSRSAASRRPTRTSRRSSPASCRCSSAWSSC